MTTAEIEPSPTPAAGPYRRRLLANSASSAMTGVWSIALGFGVTALLLARLGPSSFGLWALAQSLSIVSGWTSILVYGPSVAVARSIAERAGADTEPAEMATFARQVVTIFALIAGLAATLLALGATPLASTVFRLDGSDGRAFAAGTRWFALQIVAEGVIVGLAAVFEGYQRLDRARMLDAVRRTAAALAAVLVVAFSTDLTLVLAAQAIATAVVAAAILFGARLAPTFRLDRSIIHDLRRSAIGPVALNSAGVLHRMMDRALVTMMLGPTALAVVEVASRLQDVVRLVLATSSQTVVSAAPYLSARQEEHKLRDLVLISTRLSTGVTLVVAAALAGLAHEILTVWTDGATAALATGPLLFGLLYLSIEAPFQVINNFLTGLGQMRRLLVASWLGVIVNLALTIVLIDRNGVVGAFQGTLAGSVFTVSLLSPLLLKTTQATPIELLRRCLAPAVPTAAAILAVAVLLHRLPLAPIATLAVAAPLLGATAAVVGWSTLLDATERSQLRSMLQRRG
ncbi:MAG: polysaccharide biosynthesis C-terminal domain-containing protein [Acidimicrobiales bacterium]